MNLKFIFSLLVFWSAGLTSQTASNNVETWTTKIITDAKAQVGKTVEYNPAYKSIAYPEGDVPFKEGVCTDVIIRAFRSLKIDLQKLVHEDMQRNWVQYPKLWGLERPDKNIDHRRVPNLVKFFTNIAMTSNPQGYLPGDIIIWNLGGGVLHIGILSDDCKSGKQLVLHNISSGVKQENILNDYKIVQRFRLNPVVIERLRQLQGLQ
jgi:uncharacterized protein